VIKKRTIKMRKTAIQRMIKIIGGVLGIKSFLSLRLIFFIVSLIIVVVCYGMFIRYARQIRYMMIDLNITRANL